MEAEAAPPARNGRVWLRRIATWLVAVLALWFVVNVVPFRDRCDAAGCQDGLITTLRRCNVPLLCALFGLHLGGTIVWSARWRALLGLAKVHVPLREVWRITLEAQAGGILLPGIGGDALRIAYVRGRHPDAPLAKVLASVVADRIVGLVTMASLSCIAALVFGAGKLGGALPVIAAIPAAAVLGWVVLRHPSVARSPFLSAPGFRAKLIKPILDYASEREGPRAMERGLLLSVGVSAVQLIVVRGLVGALGGAPDHEAWICIGTTFAMMIGALPLAPGAWGTTDAAFVFFFGQAGVSPSVAAAACLLYRVFWYVTGLIGAISALLRRGSRAPDST